MRSRPPCGSTLKTWSVALGVCVPGLALQATERTHLRLALHDSIRTVDPRQTVDENSRSIEDLIHCSLMQRDADGQLIPGLAAKDPQWKSPKILEVTVKAGVKFSDGSAVTANDVAAIYHALVTDKALARSRSFQQVTAVQAQGETVSFTLHEPDASFIGNLVVGILPAKLAKTRTIDPIQSPSCGPYHMKSHEWNSIILKENPHYAGSPKLRLKQIEIRFSLDEKIRLAQLQAGELDLVQNGISLPGLKEIAKKNPQLEVLKRPGLNTTYLGFNLRDGLAGQAAVREAIAHAINRDEIISMILGGMATPATTLLPPHSPFLNQELKPRPLDLSLAEKILDDAGLTKKGETRLALNYKTTTDITSISIAKAIAAQVKKIGIKIVVEPVEWRRLKQDLDAGRVQLWSLTWDGGTDPDMYRHAFATRSFPPRGDNRGRYSNPKLDEVLEKGKITSSQDQRIRIYQEAQMLLDKDLPYIFLWHEDQFAVVNRALKGFQLRADGRYTALTEAFFVP